MSIDRRNLLKTGALALSGSLAHAQEDSPRSAI